MPRTTAPSTNPRILSGYAPYPDRLRSTSTPEWRRQVLLEDPHARDVQPEQVTCTHCAKIVRLQKGKRYHLSHWLDHRWRCDSVAEGPSPRAKCLTIHERRAVLETDNNAKVVEPDRVVCRQCDRIVKLRKGRPYSLACWMKHKLTCRELAHPPVSSGSGLTSHEGRSTHLLYSTLASDPYVASIESRRLRCALCLSWVEIEPQRDRDFHTWRTHRTSCVVNHFSNNRCTGPEPLRPRQHFATGSEVMDTHILGSFDFKNPPPSPHISPRCIEKKTQDQAHTGKLPPIIYSERTPSPPPPVIPPLFSFSTPTSLTNSLTVTPSHDPERKPSLFPNSRHLPFPAKTLSALERHERGAQFDAFDLYLTPLRIPFPCSPASDRSSRPPPYLERTPISLPLPERYWRFESLDKSTHCLQHILHT